MNVDSETIPEGTPSTLYCFVRLYAIPKLATNPIRPKLLSDPFHRYVAIPMSPSHFSNGGIAKPVAITISREPMIRSGIANVIPSLIAIRNLLLAIFEATGISFSFKNLFMIFSPFLISFCILSYKL